MNITEIFDLYSYSGIVAGLIVGGLILVIYKVIKSHGEGDYEESDRIKSEEERIASLRGNSEGLDISTRRSKTKRLTVEKDITENALENVDEVETTNTESLNKEDDWDIEVADDDDFDYEVTDEVTHKQYMNEEV